MKEFLKCTTAILVILLMTLTACGPVNKQIQPTSDNMNKVRSIAVVVPDEPEVTVYCDRTKATAAPALMFGLIGAAIASSHNQSLDQQKADQIIPNVKDMSCRSLFSEAFSKRLQDSNRFEKVDVFNDSNNVDADQYNAIINFDLISWGLRLKNKDTDDMSSFIEMDISMTDTKTGAVLWQQREVALGDLEQSFKKYVNNREGLRKSMEETAQELGDRMANMILYP